VHMYHAMIRDHLQQLVHLLGLHYNGKGWSVIRSRLREAIPRGHVLQKFWLGEAKTVAGKCFMRMRMINAYRHVRIIAYLLRHVFAECITSSIYMHSSLIFYTILVLTKI